MDNQRLSTKYSIKYSVDAAFHSSSHRSAFRTTLDSTVDVPSTKTKEILIDKLLSSLNSLSSNIQSSIEALQSIDIAIQIVKFKLHDTTYNFKMKIAEVKEERTQLLASIENRSELSLIVNDIDQKISNLQKEFDERQKTLRKEKINLQHQVEAIIFQLDDDTLKMKHQLCDLKTDLEAKTSTMYKSQVMQINMKYEPLIREIEEQLSIYEKLQMAGWRVESSEEKLAEILDKKGIKFTPSGRLLTQTGSLITFQEAQDKGFFEDVHLPMEKIVQFFSGEPQVDQLPSPTASYSEEGSTIHSRMSSEEVRYLKQYVGKALTLGLAEITTRQPRDPIHYLAHYLFKYRYNQEIEEIEKKEIEELTKERERLAVERWKKFVEDEARNAVIDMIVKAEEIAIQNELKRIEEEQLRAQEEEEENEAEEEENLAELMEEARDKFE